MRKLYALKKNIQQHPLSWFYIISILIVVATLLIFLLIGAEDGIMKAFEKAGLQFNTDLVTAFRVILAAPESSFGVILSLVSVASVDIAVLIVAKIAYGNKGLAELKNRFRFWKKGMKWHHIISVWGTCLLTFSAMNLATGILNNFMLASTEFTWKINLFTSDFWLGFLIAMFLDGGAVFEENGWRGFALPLLQNRFSPLKASIILGFMWFGWHIPVKFDIFFYGFENALKLFFILMIKFILLSIVMTFFFNQAGGVTIIAIAMHGISNDSLRLAGQILSDSYTVYLLTEINLVIPLSIVAISLILKTKGRLGLQ